jgi:hypothetical protein
VRQGKRRVLAADTGEEFGQVEKLPGDKVDLIPLALNATVDPQHGCGEDCPTVLLIHLGPDDEVGDADLVLHRDEHHALRSPRHLADQHQT